MNAARRGSVLLEVLVALTIFGVSGTLLLARAGAVADAQERIVQRERELVAASSLLAEVATLERSEFVIRIGRRVHGSFIVQVDRPEAALFRVGVAPAAAPETELLATAVYRPATQAER